MEKENKLPTTEGGKVVNERDSINFTDFQVKLRCCLIIKDGFDNEWMHDFYSDFKEQPQQYITVKEWAEDFFQEVTLDTHSYCLVAKLFTKPEPVEEKPEGESEVPETYYQITGYERKLIRSTLALMNFMISGGQEHSDHTRVLFSRSICSLDESEALPIPKPTPVPLESETRMTAEFIICSAIWFQDGKEYIHEPINIKTGFVVSGRRHHNCYTTLSNIGKAVDLEKRVREVIEVIGRDSQGFLTNTNRFVDRKEGYIIAQKAGQLLHNKHDKSNPTLISEDLW